MKYFTIFFFSLELFAQEKIYLVYSEKTQDNEKIRFYKMNAFEDKILIINEKKKTLLIDTLIKKASRIAYIDEFLQSNPSSILPVSLSISKQFISINLLKNHLFDRKKEKLIETSKSRFNYEMASLFKDSLLRFVTQDRIILYKNNYKIDSTKVDYTISNYTYSPYIPFILENANVLAIPVRRNALPKNLTLSQFFKRYNIYAYDLNAYSKYIPRAISDNYLYWSHVDYPYKIIMTDLKTDSKVADFELNKSVINYNLIDCRIIQMSEGDEGTPDKEGSVLYAADKTGNLYISFLAKDKVLYVYKMKSIEKKIH